MERGRKKGLQMRRIVPFLSLVLWGLCMASVKGYAADKVAQGSLSYSSADVKEGSILVKQIDVEIPSDDKYVVCVNWEEDTEGVCTGVVLLSGDKVLFASSGEGVQSESGSLHLKSGNYTFSVYCLQNEEQEQEFLNLTGAERIGGGGEYAFSSAQEFQVTGEFYMKEAEGESLFYLLGFAAGVLMAVLIVFILSRIAKKFGGKVAFGCGGNGKDYDERQILARGNAYKVGFFTLTAYIVLMGLLAEMMDFILSFSMLWIGVCIAVGVFVIICVVKDAYMSLRENAKGIMILFGGVGILNLLASLFSPEPFVETVQVIQNGRTYECVKLSNITADLSIGILFLTLIAVLAGKLWYDKKHEEEDSEE